MHISGYDQPEPCYGIGVPALVQRWIDLEIAQRAAGMHEAARNTRLMRRQLQEAADLVADPEVILRRPPSPPQLENPS